MFTIRPSRRRAFTLVEMLVVLGIIAILVALLMPAVMAAVNRGRITRMGMELAQLKDAIEKYKTDKGDYPPNFRDAPAVIRHIRRCYPKIALSEFNAVIDTTVSPPQVQQEMQLDEGESLVFWLAGTRNNAQYPFGLTGGSGTATVKYYDFPEQRLVDNDLNATFVSSGYPSIPSFRPEYAKETYYLYLDSRSYDELLGYDPMTDTFDFSDPETAAYGEFDASVSPPTINDAIVRPYWSEHFADSTATVSPKRFKPMEPTNFQLICAGQDGDFGYLDAAGNYATDVKFFPSGGHYHRGDKDNITNFSGGKKLNDHIP